MALLAAGCVQAGGGKKSEPVAFVNGRPITADDVRAEIELHAKKDPAYKATLHEVREQIEVLVDRRLLIQEAQERRLTEDKRFTRAIQSYWEQTLIRLLMDRFHDEFDSLSSVTDEEIAAYYALLGEKATFRIRNYRSQEAAVEAAKALVEDGVAVDWQETVGPVRYDDVRSEALERAFLFKPGEVKVFSRGEVHALVLLAAKEKDEPPALDSIKEKIRARIAERKERRAFDDWLADRRTRAQVQVDFAKLEKLATS